MSNNQISLELLPLENCPVLVAFVPFHLLSFLCFVHHNFNTGIVFVFDLFEHLVFSQVLEMPFVEFQHIGNAVQSPLGLEQEGVFRKEAGVDDPPSIVFGFEMWVGEADEYLLQTLLWKVLAQMSHCVCPHNSNMIVGVRFFVARSSDLLGHEIHQFISDFQSQHQFIGEKRGETKKKASEATPDIDNGDIFTIETVVSGLLVEGGMFNSVAAGFLIVLLAAVKFEGEVGPPVDKGVMWGEGKGGGIERVDVCAHAVVLFLGHLAVEFDYLLVALILV